MAILGPLKAVVFSVISVFGGLHSIILYMSAVCIPRKYGFRSTVGVSTKLLTVLFAHNLLKIGSDSTVGMLKAIVPPNNLLRTKVN